MPSFKKKQNTIFYIYISSLFIYTDFFFVEIKLWPGQKTEKLWNTIKDLWITFHVLIGS